MADKNWGAATYSTSTAAGQLTANVSADSANSSRTIKIFIGTVESQVSNAKYSTSSSSLTNGKVATSSSGVKSYSKTFTGLTSGVSYYWKAIARVNNTDTSSSDTYNYYHSPSTYSSHGPFKIPAAVTYTYTITFYANGGTGAGSSRSTGATTATSYTFSALTSSEEPTRSGYIFLGWDTSSAGKTVVYETGDRVTAYSSNPNIKLYAVWKEQSYEKISATGWDYTVANQTTSSFDIIISGISNTNARTFRGYLTTSPSTSVPSAWSSSYRISKSSSGSTSVTISFTGLSSDTTYYWHIQGKLTDSYNCYCLPSANSWGNATTLPEVQYYTYRIIFNANGGTLGTTGRTDISEDTDYQFSTPLAPTPPTRSGYKFLGWSTNPSATSPEYTNYQSPKLYSLSPSITLYAVWAQYITYYLWLDGNGGTLQGTTGYSSYNADGYATFGPPIAEYEPIRTNYRFLGWSKNANATSATYVNTGTITLYSGEPNVTIYAIWKPPITYKIIFNANGGTGGGTQRTKSSAESKCTFSALQSSETPTREGYDFLGWSVISTATTPTYVIGDEVTVYESEPTITLYAIWKKVEYPNDTATLTIESPTPILLTLKLSNITARNYDRTIKVSCGSSLYTEIIKAGAVSFQRTFTDLTPGTSYATSAYIYAPDERETWKETRTGYTQFGFNWTNTIAQGQPVSNLTASDWNKYMGLLAEKAKRHDATSPKYTTVASEDPMTATICNQPTLALYYIYGYYPVSSVAKGYTIYASFFNDLKTYLNTDDN